MYGLEGTPALSDGEVKESLPPSCGEKSRELVARVALPLIFGTVALLFALTSMALLVGTGLPPGISIGLVGVENLVMGVALYIIFVNCAHTGLCYKKNTNRETFLSEQTPLRGISLREGGEKERSVESLTSMLGEGIGRPYGECVAVTPCEELGSAPDEQELRGGAEAQQSKPSPFSRLSFRVKKK